MTCLVHVPSPSQSQIEKGKRNLVSGQSYGLKKVTKYEPLPAQQKIIGGQLDSKRENTDESNMFKENIIYQRKVFKVFL